MARAGMQDALDALDIAAMLQDDPLALGRLLASGGLIDPLAGLATGMNGGGADAADALGVFRPAIPGGPHLSGDLGNPDQMESPQPGEVNVDANGKPNGIVTPMGPDIMAEAVFDDDHKLVGALDEFGKFHPKESWDGTWDDTDGDGWGDKPDSPIDGIEEGAAPDAPGEDVFDESPEDDGGIVDVFLEFVDWLIADEEEETDTDAEPDTGNNDDSGQTTLTPSDPEVAGTHANGILPETEEDGLGGCGGDAGPDGFEFVGTDTPGDGCGGAEDYVYIPDAVSSDGYGTDPYVNPGHADATPTPDAVTQIAETPLGEDPAIMGGDQPMA